MKTIFVNKEERYEMARHLALILRELAPSLGLNVDKYGWVSVRAVLVEMKARFPQIEFAHIKEISDKDAQKRFEISGERIRAKAGHKYDVLVPSSPVEPPELLYHGTSPDAARLILESGILRMGKAYVHLATTIERARRIGLRKIAHPVILKVDARRAFKAGAKFWRSGQISPDGEIFLSEEIPSDFVSEICE